MKWHRLSVWAGLALAMAAGAGAAQDQVVVSTYDGPPHALNQTEILSGICAKVVVEFRFVRATAATPGKLTWWADGSQVADLSDTALGRDWTSPSLLTHKTLACENGLLSLTAVGVDMAQSGAVRHVLTWARLEDGKVSRYGPVTDIDPAIVSYRVTR